jgi:membrane-bound lytic murein transglycosylase D
MPFRRILVILPFFFISCAAQREVSSVRDNDAIAKMLKENQGTQTAPPEAPPKTLAPPPVLSEDKKEHSSHDIENLTLDEVIRIEEPNVQTLYDNSRYDFPITVNARVEGWIDYFTGKGRGHMERYLSRSSRYIPLMKQIFKNAGLPEDLVYLALIESGFNLRAKSRARAVGPWQFMKATGKRYGLRVDSWVDERRDPILSTEAAANYLKDLYLMFESWYLAASAYNAGEYKILRAIEQLKTNNYWRICQTNALRRETKDYIPKLIAAAIIAKNPARYGFEGVTYQEPLEFDTVTINYPIKLKQIAKMVDADDEELEDLNPAFVHAMVPPQKGPYEIRLPVGTKTLVGRALSASSNQVLAADMPYEHTIKHGDTIANLARRYRIRTKDLANANNMSPKEKLVAGFKIIVPKRYAPGAAQIPEKASSSKKPSNAEPEDRVVASVPDGEGFVIHKVKRGESLWSIAED